MAFCIPQHSGSLLERDFAGGQFPPLCSITSSARATSEAGMLSALALKTDVAEPQSNYRGERDRAAMTAPDYSDIALISELSLFLLRKNDVPVISIGFRNRFLALAPTIAGG
jgi:hypothetical protein